MRNLIQRLAAAASVACAILATGSPSLAANYGAESAMSPTHEMIVSWEEGSPKLSFLNVETGKIGATYNAGFPVTDVVFSLSGRFICVGGKDTLERVRIVALGPRFRSVLLQSEAEGTKPRCVSPQSPDTLNPALPMDSRSDNLITILRMTSIGTCGLGLPKYQQTTTQYWDPRRKNPKLLAQFTHGMDFCP